VGVSRVDSCGGSSGATSLMAMGRSSMSKQISKPPQKKKWSAKRKRSVNCARPKGFSEKAYCAGRKKRGKKG
jgi:hypothetical protein